MKVKITVGSQQLSKEDLQALVQAIRSCEQESFPDKKLSILIEVPELPAIEATEIISSIKPSHGLTWVFKRKDT